MVRLRCPIKEGTSLQDLFHDIEPIEQDDGPNPVCSIKYSYGFKQAMGYLRSIMKVNERSERALYLTEKCIRLNPANYTTWHFRRSCLYSISQQQQQQQQQNKNKIKPTKYLEELVDKDLELAALLGGPNPKNYQVWYHRRTLLQSTFESIDPTNNAAYKKSIKTAEKELDYINSILEEDAKNYHAWSNRQWILSLVSSKSLYESELVYIHSLLLSDPRNNSAWNQRWFASHHGNPHVPLSADDALKEAQYAWSCIEVDVWNESPWNYLLAIGKEQCNNKKTIGEIWDWSNWEEKVVQLGEILETPCHILMSAHVNILEMIGDHDSRKKAAQFAHNLAVEHDKIRVNFWLMREQELLS